MQIYSLTVVGLLAFVVAYLVTRWVRQPGGFMLTPDSLNYLSAAQSFRDHHEFLSPDGTRYTNWPPLFPIILSMFDDPLKAMIWIDFVCKSIIALLTAWMASRFLTTLLLQVIFLAVSLLSVHFLLIGVFLWSEIVFMALLFVYLFVSLKVREHPRYFVLLIILGFLLCLQRNAGLYWVVGTALWMWLNDVTGTLKKIVRYGSFVFFSASGLMMWHAYNVWFIAEGVQFYERPFFKGLFHNIEMISVCLGKAFVPASGGPAMICGWLLIICVSVYGFRFVQINERVQLLLICIITYTLGFLPIPKLDVHDMDRYFAVIFPIFLLLPLLTLEFFMIRSRIKPGIVGFVLVLWVIYPVARMTKNAIFWHDSRIAKSHK